MKKIRLQKKYIAILIALTVVCVLLAVSLIMYFRFQGGGFQNIPNGILITLVVLLISLPFMIVLLLFLKKTKAAKWIGYLIIGISVLAIGGLLFIAGLISDNKSTLIFTSESSEKTYDGTPLKCEKWNLKSGKLSSGHTAEITFGDGLIDAGSVPNYFNIIIYDGNKNDVTDNYKIDFRPGVLKVNALSVSIKSGSAFKMYDGTALRENSYEMTDGFLLQNHNLSVETLGERIDAGLTKNNFVAVVKDANNKDVTFNYSIEKDLGNLEVGKRRVSLSTPSLQKLYDSTPLTHKEWSYASETQVLSNHTIEVVVSGSITDVGMCQNSIAEVIVTEGSKNVTANYEFKYLEGLLIVTPRRITVRSASDSKTYDGSPLTNGNWSIESQTDLISEHTITVAVSGTRTEVGESPNTVAETIIHDVSGRNVTFNYDINLQEGILVVHPPQPSPPENSTDTDLDDSGTIGGDLSSGEKTAVRVYSQNSGKIYLRYLSFGDYSKTRWENAGEYKGLIDSKYSLNYLTGLTLKNAGYKSSPVSIESLGTNYLLPYYLDLGELSYQIQTSDVKYAGNTNKIYSAYYYFYDYAETGLNYFVPNAYKDIEQSYYEYVKSCYLSMPSDTNEFFRHIIQQQGFSLDNKNVIKDIANYIQNAAIYNKEYDKSLDVSDDVAVNFLKSYKEGICQHFATAATMLYRALGLPARYVIGYVGDTKKGEWVDISEENAHAWVEVYLKGAGWVQIEVTGAGFGESGNTPEETQTLKIKPADLAAPYENGIVLKPDSRIQGINHLINQGYFYTVKVSGSLSKVGLSESKIDSFVLYDPTGKDVTANFKIDFGTGKLHLYLRELTVTTESLKKTYDGSPLCSLSGTGYSYEGDLFKGHKFEKFAASGKQTDVGQSENSCEIVIVDETGVDVTYLYKIITKYGTLVVETKKITVEAGSDKKVYDGMALTCKSFKVKDTEGYEALGEGDKIFVTIEGSQTEIGKSQNEIVSVKIINKHGKDVTKNCTVEYLSGWLIVSRF